MKQISVLVYVIALAVGVAACEGCVKNTAKKATNMGLDVLEGVAEAVNERGDTLGQKILDATGTVAQGAGRSLDRQLNEHAETVAAVAGRTLVQTVDGLEDGLYKEGYDELVSREDLCSDVALSYFGKMKSKPVTDARFIISRSGTYAVKFEFCSDNCETVVLTKTAEIVNPADHEKYSLVSFAYNREEQALLEKSECTRITVTRK